MEEHFNGLTPAEHERLSILLEELGEAQQIIGKILRHGYESTNPNFISETTNRELLEKELGDVMFAIRFLCDNDLKMKSIEDMEYKKSLSIVQWLHHN